MLLFDASFLTPHTPRGRHFMLEPQPAARRGFLITLYPYRLPIKKIIGDFLLNNITIKNNNK
jgi:hypothetical protein